MTRLFAAALAVCGLLGAGACAGGDARDKVAAHWTDLSALEESRVVRAILGLASRPDETVSFLKEQLRPVKDDPARVVQLLGDLGSPKFAVRQRASLELEFYGKYIKGHVEKALAEKPEVEMAKRLQGLVDKMPQPPRKIEPPAPLFPPGKGVSIAINGGTVIINGKRLEEYMIAPLPPAGPPAPPSSWVRAARVVGVLEHLGTSAARELIERLASGEAEALPTIEARAALARMGK